jgi:hypothetical protein
MEETRSENGERNQDQEGATKGSGQQIDTGGGSYIAGGVDTRGGDFIGRDQVVITEEKSYDVTGLANPYLGLRSFTYDDRASFAGREKLIEDALEKIANPTQRQTLTFITGASGSGKSSFAQAGLIPALEVYYHERHKTVRRGRFQPGSDPLAMLADGLSQLGLREPAASDLDHFTSAEFSGYFEKNTSADEVNLLLIDQFEELFTTADAQKREQFIELISNSESFENIRTHIIATLRSDYLKEISEIGPLWELASIGVVVRAMNAEEMKDAIQRPLQAAAESDEQYRDKRFEPGLIEELAQEASQEATYLPLLQVTLEELWRNNKLKLENYQGLTTAISQRADKVYKFEDYDDSDPLDERPQQDRDEILSIFLDLVSVSMDDKPERDVRRSRAREDLESVASLRDRLINDLIQSRLLSVHVEKIGTDQVDVEFVNIIHDTLILNWELLMKSIQEKRDQLKRRIRFEQELFTWKNENNSEDYLLTGSHLREARDLSASSDIALQNDMAKEFFEKSLQNERSRQRRSMFWRSLPAGSIGGGIGFSLASILILFNQRIEDTLIFLLATLIIYFLIGLFSVGLFSSLGIVLARTIPQKFPQLARWILGGLGGVLGFSIAVVAFNSFWVTQERDPLGLVILEGFLWGLASGLSITWAVFSRRLFWIKVLPVGLLGGFALTVGESIGKSFLIHNPVENPATWQIFIAGALVPVCILAALSLTNRGSRPGED